MRTVKAPHIRREELINAAEALFDAQGIDDTPVAAIIGRAGVAKGTFYWYFASKEALLDALVERKIDRFLTVIQPILEDDAQNALDKLRAVFAAHDSLCHAGSPLRDFMHRPENLMLHQKHQQLERQRLCPVLGRILGQGVAEGTFSTAHPETAAEFLLLTAVTLVHPPELSDAADRKKHRDGVRDILERVLGAAPGSLDFLLPADGSGHDRQPEKREKTPHEP